MYEQFPDKCKTVTWSGESPFLLRLQIEGRDKSIELTFPESTVQTAAAVGVIAVGNVSIGLFVPFGSNQ